MTGRALARLLAALGIVLAPGLAAGCGGGSRSAVPVREPELPPAQAIDLRVLPEQEEIVRLEDARSDGGGRLVALLADERPAVRERAARALGRLPFPEYGAAVTGALERALDDPESDVRATAAFALGLRGDDDAAGALIAHWSEQDPAVRARVVEAASRLDSGRARTRVLGALYDPEPRVAIEAAIGPHRWEPGAAGADAADRELLNVLATRRKGKNDELAWRILFSLQRRRAASARDAFVDHARSPHAQDVLARLFAVKGLARIDPDEGTLAVLREAVRDPDWRIACEAVQGLGEHRDTKGAAALLESVEHPSPHVRRAAFVALGQLEGDVQGVTQALWRGSRDVSGDARAAAIEALAGRLPAGEAVELVAERARASDPVVRAGAALGAARLQPAAALPILEQLSADENLRVAGQAIEALGQVGTDEARARLLELVNHRDRGIQLDAVIALQETTRESDLPHLLQAWRGALSSEEDIAPELCFNLIENLGRVGGDEARDAITSAWAHRNPWVREVARRVLAERFDGAELPRAAFARPTDAEVPLPGRDSPLWKNNPRVEIATTRGSMYFELFPAEAPLHVHSFLQLVAADHYDGLIFHRVVPDFVIQGGDVRGDGNGGRSWRGDSLRHEIGPRKYVRGSLGMPRNEYLESGGSQIFVTHRPTPHLDGRYTIFGELRQGFDVLDRIEVGDRILDVRLIDRPPPTGF